MRVTSPDPGRLTLRARPVRARVRLGIWLVLVGIFVAGLLREGGTTGAWLAMLVPLVLLPYLLDAWRELHGVVWEFDAVARVLSHPGGAPIDLARIAAVEVDAVNGTCEEAVLRLRLVDGGAMTVVSGEAFAATLSLAHRVAALCAVPVCVAGRELDLREV